jgi:hypothetical protein
MPLLERLDGARGTSPRNHLCHQAGVPRFESWHTRWNLGLHLTGERSCLRSRRPNCQRSDIVSNALAPHSVLWLPVGVWFPSLVWSISLAAVLHVSVVLFKAPQPSFVWEALDIRVCAVKSGVSRSRREFSGNCESRAPVHVSDLARWRNELDIGINMTPDIEGSSTAETHPRK